MSKGQAMYYGQRDWRGRPEIFMDTADGKGPRRLKITGHNGEKLVPEWGARCDIGRRNLLARAILMNVLDGDLDWVLQICHEFGEQVIERLPLSKWTLAEHQVLRAVTAIEMGEKISLRW